MIINLAQFLFDQKPGTLIYNLEAKAMPAENLKAGMFLIDKTINRAFGIYAVFDHRSYVKVSFFANDTVDVRYFKKRELVQACETPQLKKRHLVFNA